MIAKCNACSAMFGFSAADAGQSPKPRRERPAVPMPAGWRATHEAGSLVITHRWFKPLFTVLVFFVCIWNSLLVKWYSIALDALSDEGITFATLLLLFFPVLHVAIGVGLSYYTLAGFLNTTSIIARPGELIVKHHPMPWLHAGSINRRQLKQLYCKEKRQQNEGEVYYTYKLCALLKNGRERILLSNLESPDQALYIEYEMEKFLGIEDRSVAGGYKG
jgi:hypothetical protein